MPHPRTALVWILWTAAPWAGPATALEAGQQAPGFTAESTEGTIDPADYRRKKYVLLAFYYKGFTGEGTAEMRAFQDDISSFEALDTRVEEMPCPMTRTWN